MEHQLISVIVPIFNAEHTLPRCLDSIMAQSYRNLEILLINDGSTDSSSKIIAEYAAKDIRFSVFQIAHNGLSAARNVGIDNAHGSWIAFVDADDWIEQDTFKKVIEQSCDVDIIAFGRWKDSPKTKIAWSPSISEVTIDQNEAIKRLIVENTIKPAIWDKIYRREMFNDVRFPEGYNYEEIRTTYKLIQAAGRIRLIPDNLYHYTQNSGSIVHNSTSKNRLDHWTACYELYKVFSSENEGFYKACVSRCMSSIARTWGVLWKSDDVKRINEVVQFARDHQKEVIRDGKKSRYVKLIIPLVVTGKRWSMYVAYLINSIYRVIRPVSVYRNS
jgi:glycosyltransferase involved in cell wall biosynthesis